MSPLPTVQSFDRVRSGRLPRGAAAAASVFLPLRDARAPGKGARQRVSASGPRLQLAKLVLRKRCRQARLRLDLLRLLRSSFFQLGHRFEY